MLKIQILPSLLAADFGNLASGARLAEESGGDALHIDIMDGHFVPNLSMGPDVVKMASASVRIPLSVHLMMKYPHQYISRFIDAGADYLLIHIEAACDVPEALERIRELGASPGITINPETPVELIYPVVSQVDQVLCMTVHPGYGGQAFMNETLPKIQALRKHANMAGNANLDIMVDGGIDINTIAVCAAKGANCFVAGTSLYRSDNMAGAVEAMRSVASGAFRHDP